MRTIEQMVQQEVNCCMSSLVSTLALGYGGPTSDALADLVNQAFELASPIPDYEEAAIQTGWKIDSDGDIGIQQDRNNYLVAESWQDACEQSGIEPYDREVFEHWAVSQWLAEKLIAAGEKVDTDFANLNVWARTCSGQGVASDGVIERIYADMMKA